MFSRFRQLLRFFQHRKQKDIFSLDIFFLLNLSLFFIRDSFRRPTFLNHSTFTGSALTLLSAYSSTDSAAQNTTAQCSQIPSLNHEAVSPTPPLSARSADSQQAFSVNGATSVNSTNNTTLTADEMTNRLRRPLSAIGSLMSGSQSAENGSQSSHEVISRKLFDKNEKFID